MVILCACLSASGADWPQFLGADRDGVSKETGLARTWPEGGPKVLWTVSVGIGWGGAAVVDGKVYLLDRIEGKQDVVRCLDLASGSELWRYAYDAPGETHWAGSRSTPAVDKDYVFSIGEHGDLYCVSQQTHQPLWSKNIKKDFGGPIPQWDSAQSPLLYKDTVIISPLSKSVGVMALDKKTGEVKWKSPAAGKMAYCSPTLATIDGVDQIVAESLDGFAGVEVGTGKVLWTYNDYVVGTAPCPSPEFLGERAGGGLFFATGGYNSGSAFFKVSREGDKFVAKTVVKKGDIGSHVHNGLLWKDHIYINSDNFNAGLACLDLEGNVKWKTGKSLSLDKGDVLVADGLIFAMEGPSRATATAGTLHLVEASPDGYKPLAKAKVLNGKTIWGPMSLSNGKLLLRDATQLKCLDVSAGK